MTMQELARLSGVSVSTVSKAFSGSKEISEAKREHIFAVARKNGCYDKYCRSKYSGKIIAVICPEYKSGYYSALLSLFEKEIRKRGAIMLSSSTDFDNDRTLELLSYFSEYAKADGIIVMSDIKSGTKLSVPIVTLGDSKIYDSISLSEERAVEDAVAYLKKNGHRNIAFISEPLTQSRLRLFISAMKKSALEIDEKYIILSDGRFEESGYKGMNTLLSLDAPPTAIIAAYDDIAFGAMKSIAEHNLTIPDDISVIGFDDNRLLPYLNIPLSSITAYNEDLCEIAVNLLFEKIDRHTAPRQIKISKEFIPRDSVGKAKNIAKEN